MSRRAADPLVQATPDGRPLQETAVGSRHLQRWTDLTARLLAADGVKVALVGEVATVAGGAGLSPGSVGRQVPLDESLSAITVTTAPDPLVVSHAAADPRLAALPAVVRGEVGAVLGTVLTGPAGDILGALSAFTRQPRVWTESEVSLLHQLADTVATELRLSAVADEYESQRVRFELAIDAAGIGGWDWDLVTGRLLWDDRVLDLFGYTRDSFEETIEAFDRRVHPDDRARVDESIRAALASGGGYEAEYRIVLPGGETRWVRARGHAVTDEHGAAVRLVGATYDTTGERNADARVARVLETMAVAFLSLDRDWRITYVNAEAERVLDRPRDELLGGDLWELYPDALHGPLEERYRAALETGEQQVFEVYYPAPLDGWFEVRAWPDPSGLSVYFLDLTERRAAEERARRSSARLKLVADISTDVSVLLRDGLGEVAAMRRLTQGVVPDLADWAIASVIEEDGRLRDLAGWHADPAQRDTVARYRELRRSALAPTAPLLTALASGRPVLVDDAATTIDRVLPDGPARAAFHDLRTTSYVVVPLFSRTHSVGALTLYRSAGRPPADQDDVAAVREVAGRVAQLLESSRLHEQQRRLAEGLQRSLLTEPPESDHAEIAVRYLPAVEVAEVGGDWYDAFVQPDGATMVVIGDVVGHDTEAAAAMGQLRGLLRGIAYRHGAGPADVLTGLDVAMHGLGVDTMATAAIGRVERIHDERGAGSARLRWSNAGHPPPLLLHDDGRVEQLSGPRAELMLGVDPGAARSEREVTVSRGATVLLYTDGLIEGRDAPLDEGLARLHAELSGLAGEPLEVLCDELVARLRPGRREDDVAIVAIRLHPQE